MAETLASGASRTLTYGYDEVNRLRSETSAAASPVSTPQLHYRHEYTFDLAGNRLSKDEYSGDGGSGWGLAKHTAYSYDHRDRLLLEQAALFDNPDHTATTTVFDYDRNGFLKRKAATMAGGAPPPDETCVFTALPPGRPTSSPTLEPRLS